jgi:hypothetical protein
LSRVGSVFAPVPGTREVVPGARASVEPDADVRVTGGPRWGCRRWCTARWPRESRECRGVGPARPHRWVDRSCAGERERPSGHRSGARPESRRFQVRQCCGGLQGGPDRAARAADSASVPALPLALTCRTDWCPAGRLARIAEDRGPHDRRKLAPCRWPIPDLHGDPSRGLMTANSGQAACRPSAGTGYEAPPPRKSGTVQLQRAGADGPLTSS